MNKSKLTLIALALSLCGMSKAFGSTSTSSQEYVYVESNLKTPNGNSIYVYKRGSGGELTAISGSPFLTGGAGTQYAGVNVGPQDSDQNIITNKSHTLLFAVNSGSDTIAVFHINANGSLWAIDGSPFPSGGNDPVSLALDGNILFVVNKSGDPGRPSAILPNYTTLMVSADGILTPFDDKTNDSTRNYQQTVSIASGSSPSQAYIVPENHLMFGADFLSGLIQHFSYNWTGGLHQFGALALPDSEFSDTTTPRFPLGLWSHPTQPLLYVGFVTDSKLGVYRYSWDGGLTFLNAVPNSGAAICWLRTNGAGTRLYTSDTGTNSISVYDLSNPEYPVQIQNLVLSGEGDVLQFSLSEDDHYLYALSSRGATSIPEGQGNILHILTVASDGTVAETGTPVVFHLPADTRPQGVLAVTPGA